MSTNWNKRMKNVSGSDWITFFKIPLNSTETLNEKKVIGFFKLKQFILEQFKV